MQRAPHDQLPITPPPLTWDKVDTSIEDELPMEPAADLPRTFTPTVPLSLIVVGLLFVALCCNYLTWHYGYDAGSQDGWLAAFDYAVELEEKKYHRYDDWHGQDANQLIAAGFTIIDPYGHSIAKFDDHFDKTLADRNLANSQ